VVKRGCAPLPRIRVLHHDRRVAPVARCLGKACLGALLALPAVRDLGEEYGVRAVVDTEADEVFHPFGGVDTEGGGEGGAAGGGDDAIEGGNEGGEGVRK